MFYNDKYKNGGVVYPYAEKFKDISFVKVAKMSLKSNDFINY